ncbi:DUF4364 family protein [Stygiolobus caldivivus]|uniref:Uncharacterized protein n=1 Tax=Stygiolobus caldivivus TaxID=2824673 RepID=A0A8D5ZIY3_9CREN|nr:DUF4364 family protein [Stygiolobus caldivivus]BCU70051.1 hypothetical protein KN1_13480 [Stygiolobus caldivivus]
MVSEKAKELAILVIGLAGGNLTSETRFQKTAFVVNELTKFGVKFEPMDFGPFSKELADAVKELNKEKLLRYEVDDDGVVHYVLTQKGKEKLEKLKEGISKDDLEKIRAVVNKFKDAPLTYILAYVYSKYPQYTVKSKIIDKVEEWRRYYGI